MPEPDTFSPVEQLQDINKKVANKVVRDYFRDVTALEADLDLTTSRQALLKACLHREEDSQLTTILRNQLFYNFTTFARDQQPLVTGNLLNELTESNVYKPKITLFFREADSDRDPDYQAVDMECSWRLTDETSQTITKAKLTTIAERIKTRFGSGNGYVFRKGRKVISYRDKAKGYEFLIRSRSLEDGRELIRDILTMNGDSLESELLKVSEVADEAEAFPANPGTQVILGKRRNKKRKRPVTNVRFKYAYAFVDGIGQPIYLYSRNQYIPDALVAP